jgi:phosphate butyryltransferase
MVGNFDRLLEAALCIKEKRVVVIYPNNTETFDAVREAAKMKLASFVLVGDENLICGSLGDDLGRLSNSVKLVSQSNVHSALRASIELIRDGHGDILLKGGIDTSTMMKAVLQEDSGIRTGRLLSDVFILEFPRRSDNKFIMITDGGITPAPDLKNKVEIIVNAVEVAHALGNPNPKVAILSATEFVVPNLQSTIDAAALSKMNDRGQIRGCLVDGPFALDNTISMEAVGEKRIKSEVAGRAEILIAANIESANSLAKSTTYFAGLRLAHVIVGGRVPILIPSRADKSDAKLLSMALGIIMSDHYQQRGAM